MFDTVENIIETLQRRQNKEEKIFIDIWEKKDIKVWDDTLTSDQCETVLQRLDKHYDTGISIEDIQFHVKKVKET